MTTTFSSSTQLFQYYLGYFHYRKLLLETPAAASPPPSYNLLQGKTGHDAFDANVVVVLVVLLAALVCSLGLKTLSRCIVGCFIFSHGSSSDRLANTRVKKKALRSFPVVNYSTDKKLPLGMDTECVICLSEFVVGDSVRILPSCRHGFHVSCIDKWLNSHSSCPTCRHCLLQTCQKLAPGDRAAGSSTELRQQQAHVTIAPLEREGTTSNNSRGFWRDPIYIAMV